MEDAAEQQASVSTAFMHWGLIPNLLVATLQVPYASGAAGIMKPLTIAERGGGGDEPAAALSCQCPNLAQDAVHVCGGFP